MKNEIEQAIDLLEVADSNRCGICSGRLNKCFDKKQDPCGLHNAFRVAITTLCAQEAVEPEMDQWAFCPTCGYEYILEMALRCPHEDNWMPKFCPNCGQKFKYGDDWQDENGRYWQPDIRTRNNGETNVEAKKQIKGIREYCLNLHMQYDGHDHERAEVINSILTILEGSI